MTKTKLRMTEAMMMRMITSRSGKDPHKTIMIHLRNGKSSLTLN